MTDEPREWMVGLQGHKDLLCFSEVVRLVRGGSLRDYEMVKKGAEPWRAAIDIPELREVFEDVRRKESGKYGEPKTRPVPTPAKADARRESSPASSTARIRRHSRSSGRRKDRATERRSATSRIRPADRKKTTTSIPKVTLKEGEEEEAAKRGGRSTRFGRMMSARKSSQPDETATATHRQGVRDEDRPKTQRRTRTKAERVRVRLDPMVTKYYSVTDLTRQAAHAFVPRKLLFGAAILVPAFVLLGLLTYFAWSTNPVLGKILYVLSSILLVYTLAFTCTALAYMTRRNLEGDDPPFLEVLAYAEAHLLSIVLYPVIILLPTLVGLGLLWALGFLRDASPGMAGVFSAGYILFVIPGLIVMLGLICMELALAYIPSAMAVDSLRLRESVRETMGFARHHTMRMAFHWLVLTSATVLVSAVVLLLVLGAFFLPYLIFGTPPPDVQPGWKPIPWLHWLYLCLALGFASVVPLSVLSTFGTLSYLILKQEDEVFVTGPPGETAAGDDGEESQGPEETAVSDETDGKKEEGATAEKTEESEGGEEEPEPTDEEEAPEEDGSAEEEASEKKESSEEEESEGESMGEETGETEAQEEPEPEEEEEGKEE